MKWKIAIIIICIMTTGCATIVGGSKQNIEIISNPPGASVIIDEENYGETPTVVKLKRRYNHTGRIEMLGYKPHTCEFTKSFNRWVWGNIFIIHPVVIAVFIAVDFISGGARKLDPEQVKVNLIPED